MVYPTLTPDDSHAYVHRTVGDRWDLAGVLNVNARSLNSEKSDELHVVTEINQVCVTQTWFKDYMPDEAVQLQGFNCERNDRLGRAGGVAYFIDKEISYVRLKELESDLYEVLCVKANARGSHTSFHV